MKKWLILICNLWIVCTLAGADNLREIALGDSCKERFNLFGALEHYEKAFSEKDDATVRMRLAECFFRRNDYRRCIDILQPLPEDSLDQKTMREIFYCHKGLAQHGSQKKWGRKILERYPMDGEIVAELGMAYNMSDEGKMAQKICVAYWFKDHDNIAVNRVLADAYFLDREFDMAKYSYEELLAAGDTTYMVLFNLGVCYERQDSLVKARETFDKAIRISAGQMPGALYHQGTVLNAMRQYAEAQGCFEQALTLLLPDSVKMFTCYRGIAESLYAKADYGAAAEAFGQALAFQPLSLTTYYYYALCLDATGKHNVAMTNYKEFLRLAVREENPTDDLRQMIADARKRMK